jgi:hypothetical protein
MTFKFEDFSALLGTLDFKSVASRHSNTSDWIERCWKEGERKDALVSKRETYKKEESAIFAKSILIKLTFYQT